jgi:hypothetical protein
MAGVHAVFSFDDLPANLRDKPFPLLVPNPAIRQPLTFTTLRIMKLATPGSRSQ